MKIPSFGCTSTKEKDFQCLKPFDNKTIDAYQLATKSLKKK